MKTSANHDKAKRALVEIMECKVADCELSLVLAALTGDGLPDLQKVQITKDVAKHFRDIMGDVIEWLRTSYKSEDIVLHPYDTQTLLAKHEVEYFSLADNSSVDRQVKALEDTTRLDVFSGDEDFIGNLRFYVIILKPRSGEPVLFIRSYSEKKELSRSPFFAITMRSGQYDTVRERTFLFDQFTDCIVVGKWLFILKKDKFQKIFQFYEELIKSARETLNVIQKHIPIDDFQAFEKACEGHLQKLAKLKNIANKPYLKDLNITKLKKVIERYKLNIKTVGSGKNEKIHYDVSDKWGILRLLDDDYLESVMTGSSYEVNSKRSLN